MPLNHFLQPHNEPSEQNLVEDLINEAIRATGIDVYYIPRVKVLPNDIQNETSYSVYRDAFTIEVYVKSYTNFEGDGNFLGKFGLEVRDQVEITMAKRAFQERVGEYTQKSRAMEGDLIYIPTFGALYSINYVETAATFYQLGKLYTYDLTLELFEYSNEVFSTGIEELDEKYNDKSSNLAPEALLDEAGDPILTETGDPIFVNEADTPEDPFADNQPIEELADEIQDFSERDPYGEA